MELGAPSSRLLIIDSDINFEIGDRGCRHLCEGAWPDLEKLRMRIDVDSADCCSIREEGCRCISKLPKKIGLL